MVKKCVFVQIAVCVCLIGIFISCKKSADPEATCSDSIQNQGETGIDCGGPCLACLSKRDSVIADYKTNYIGSEVADPGWTGSAAGCNAGTVPQSTHDKVLMRINYFRRITGLNDNITLDASKFAQYQQTALMMKVNNALNHAPPDDWNCWTAEGAQGAGSSNLALGSTASEAITAFIEDEGDGNQVAGHRRWILHSAKMQFSYGSTDFSMALGVIGVAAGNTKIPSFIAYPPAGYVPQTLVFKRWSLGIPGADFTNASVNMKSENGTAITLAVVSRTDNAYGDNTIVWEPQGINVNNETDISYTVTINNIAGAPQTSYNYTVTLIKP